MKGRPYYHNLDKAMQLSTTSTMQAAAVNATDSQLLPANPRRLALIFSTDLNTGTKVWPQVSTQPSAGFVLFNGTAPANPQLVLTIRDHGDMVRAPWFGRGNAASGNIGIIEVLGPDIEECNRCD